MVPMGDTLASLGSRMCIVFDPVTKRIMYPRYGRFEDLSIDLAVGVKLESGAALALPFTTRYDGFPFVEQTIRMNSITFHGWSPDMGLRLVATFTSPFYPRDAKLSTAPFFYVDVHVEKLDKYRWRQIATLGPQGFVLSPVDNITVDQPRTWQNIEVLIDEWRRHWPPE